MYSYFEGKLVEKTPTYAVVDCNGIGYVLNITLNTFSAIKDKDTCKLYSHLVVREDALTLYGFLTIQELELFRKLISVSGVGPGTARMVLSSINSDELIEAITKGNVSLLKSIKGIGEKTAQRIIVDLKDKLGKAEINKEFIVSVHNTKRNEALTALLMLGFNKNSIEKTLDKILRNSDDSMSVEEIIKKSLQTL
jgi:holliday junction DNA helicase RuvA